MGEEGKECKGLEGILSKISKTAKAPFKFLRRHPAIALSIGVSAIYFASACAIHGKLPSWERAKNVFSDLNFWESQALMAIACSAGAIAAFAGFLAYNNSLRKKKRKTPLKIGKMFKRMIMPWTVGKGEQAFKGWLDSSPIPSIAYMRLADYYFGKGRIMEAMESYYSMIMARDEDATLRIPLLGPTSYVNTQEGNIKRLETRIQANPGDSRAMLELAMCYFSLNDFENAISCFERAGKDKDHLAMHILASRLYSQIGRRADKQKLNRLFGDTGISGRINKAFFAGKSPRGISAESMKKKADEEALAAAEKIFERKDSMPPLEQIEEYPVYRLRLNSLVKGFVVAKQGEPGSLRKEMENEQYFEREIATDRFKSVHPVTMIERAGKHYLILLYEEGKPLAESTDRQHYLETAMFAARSDALMPISQDAIEGYNPETHFEKRIIGSSLPDNVKMEILERKAFMFKYWKEFPPVFDGDWRADGNCLINDDGQPVALDKQDKGCTIGPVTLARVLNQGTRLDCNIKREIAIEGYIESYKHTASGRKMECPALFLPVYATSTIEKSMTAWCFTESRPLQQAAAQAFLRHGLNLAGRFCDDNSISKEYAEKDKKDCKALADIIKSHLLTSAP